MKRALILTRLLNRPPKPYQWHPISSATSKISQLHTKHRQMSQTPLPNPIEYDQATVCGTLASFNNDYQRALDFFTWIEKNCRFRHTTETYNKMIDVLGKFFEFEKSWELITAMASDPLTKPNHITFRIMFERYAMAHQVKEAFETYYRLAEFNMKDETSFANLIDALCENNHVVEADEFCRNEPEFVGTRTKIHNMILRGWSKIRRLTKCRHFWKEMDRIGVNKDLVSYTIYMDVQCKCRKPLEVVRLFKEMQGRGIRPNVVAYNKMVHAIGKAQAVDCAIDMFKEMTDFGCKPNVVTYNIIITFLCENSRTNEAYAMLDKMRKMGCEPNAVTYECFFRKLREPKEILRLFEKMIESGVQPRMDTYVMLMRRFRKWGFLRPVMVVWEKMKEMNCSPNGAAYNALIDALVDKGMVDMARKYDEEMHAKGLSTGRREELMVESEERCVQVNVVRKAISPIFTPNYKKLGWIKIKMPEKIARNRNKK